MSDNFFSAPEVMQNYVEIGKKKAESPTYKLILLGIVAGFLIGAGAVVANTASHAVTNPGIARVVSGLLFPFGLAMVMLMGVELFTGNCMIFISLLANRTNLYGMLRNWALVYLGNMIGGLLLAYSIVVCGQLNLNGGALALHTIRLATGKCALAFAPALITGILCNILVCLGVLCSLAGRDSVSRILGAYIPVVFFIIGGFEHSVANMYYIPAGIMAMGVPEYAAAAAAAGVNTASLGWGNFLFVNLVPVTIGNIIGGAGIATILWFCHARKTA
ncbi:FdhC protein [Synergistales bacterium]|nr:FdhC protein [Synergistales bacterium]